MTDRELFLAVLDVADDHAKAEILARECANYPSQRERVERLLRSHEAAGEFLEQSLDAICPTLYQSPQTHALASGSIAPGVVLAGRYTLLRLLGQGGMGVVWAAEQTEPVARLVAVKFIRPGMDSEIVVARFTAERQTLAVMDHPNIAKVFDGGTTDDGRPFVVMELVQGTPITKFCEENNLTLRQRIELLSVVCQTIHHAHQKGVIHRDLKPSNVLVTLAEGQPVPKVIDFGVAKTTHQRLATQYTHVGSVIGTPQYMSPEQTAVNPQDVDTRTDIYSLGVLLYELLTGKLPFEQEHDGTMGVIELLRRIRDEEPIKPSAALCANKAWPPRLRGELDWIIVKCLEKDRNRRYDSAHSLALDLARHLADEPVTAGPPSTTYRMRKFVRKHRHSMLALSVLTATLVVGSIGTTIGMLRAATAEAKAKEQAKSAETRFLLAQEAVNRYMTIVTDDPDLRRANHHRLRQRLLASGLEFYEQLAIEKPNDPGQMLDQVVALGRHADICRDVGDRELAQKSLMSALEILERVTTQHPQRECRLEKGRIHKRLADLTAVRGEQLLARREYDRAISVLFDLCGSPVAKESATLELVRAYNNYGLMLAQENEPSAEKMYNRACEFVDRAAMSLPNHRECLELQAVCHNNLGNFYSERKAYTQARNHLVQARDFAQKLVTTDPRDPEAIQKLAGTRANLAQLAGHEGKIREALAETNEASKSFALLVERFPQVPEYRLQWLGTELNSASLNNELGNPAVAIKQLDVVWQRLQSFTDSDFLQVREYRSNCLAARAETLEKLGESSQATIAWREALAMVPNANAELFRSGFAAHLARLQQFEEALEIAEKLEGSSLGDVRYNLSCVFALRYADSQDDDDAMRAVKHLKAAIENGYSDSDRLQKDTDLDSIRERDEFRTLIANRLIPNADRTVVSIKNLPNTTVRQ